MVDKSNRLRCQMGHHCRNLRHLPCLLPHRSPPCTEKDEQGISTSSISPSMPIIEALISIANPSLSGFSLAVNAHDLNHLLRIIFHSTVHKTDMQCTVMRLHLQVCVMTSVNGKHDVLTSHVQPTTQMATMSQHILHLRALQRPSLPRITRRSRRPALHRHTLKEDQATEHLL